MQKLSFESKGNCINYIFVFIGCVITFQSCYFTVLKYESLIKHACLFNTQKLFHY